MKNLVAHEINKMIDTVPTPKATLWERVKEWWALRGMPRGQRVWALGFKPINHAQLETRFSLALINKQLASKLIQNELDGKGLKLADVEISGFTVYSALKAISFSWTLKDKTRVVDGAYTGYCNSHWNIALQKAVVKVVALDRYIGERIPKRCMADIARAKSWGLGKMYVAYPAVEEIPQKDPIILAKWDGAIGESGSTYIEVSWWE